MFFADLQPRIYGFVKRESEFWLWLPTLKKKTRLKRIEILDHEKRDICDRVLGINQW